MPPKQVFWVQVTKADGPKLKYAERGGGLFSQLRHAEDRAAKHNKAGRDAIILVSDLDWKNPYEH